MLKKLWGETLIYGLSTVLGRMVFFLLNRLHTDVFSQKDVGVMITLYSLVGFCLILFTYRIEAAFFRYSTDDAFSENTVLKTSLISIFFTTIVLGLLFFACSPLISNFSGVAQDYYLVYLAGAVIVLDTFSEIPFAKMRLQGQTRKYARLKLLNIAILVGLNIYFLLVIPKYQGPSSYGTISLLTHYHESFNIGYVFLANIIGSGIVLILCIKELPLSGWVFDIQLWIKMIKYSLPLMVVSVSYIINEMFDRLMMIRLLPGDQASNQIQTAIYGSCYRLTIIINLFTTAYRLGAEPFFLKNRNNSSAPKLYADTTLYFLIFSCFGLLMTVLFTHQLKGLVFNSSYDAGLIIVPIVALANVFNGMYYNLSIWYRTTDRTQYGILFSLIGAAITIGLNCIFVPKYGYIAAAWATLTCYFTMSVLVYWVGKKYLFVPYNFKKIGGVLILSIILLVIQASLHNQSILISILLLLIYLSFVSFIETQKVKELGERFLTMLKH